MKIVLISWDSCHAAVAESAKTSLETASIKFGQFQIIFLHSFFAQSVCIKLASPQAAQPFFPGKSVVLHLRNGPD